MDIFWNSPLEDKYYSLKEMLWQNFIFIQCQFIELSESVFVAMITTLPRQHKLYKFCFAHCIPQPNLSFKALTILELFRIMLCKCRHYAPEPRFLTTNRET